MRSSPGGSGAHPGQGSKAWPAVFLDRDGVINENRLDYVKSWPEVRFLPGVFGALARLARSPFRIILVTNQSPISRGFVSEEKVREINTRLQEAIAARGGRLDAVYVCPHRPDEGCDCRKPAPGLLLRAAEEHEIDLAASYMVGDALSDVQAAQAAGVQPILVLTGRGRQQLALFPPGLRRRCRVVADLSAAVDWILGGGGQPEDRD